ncbi:zf-HC2 domain-containing protein [Streptomyces sp. NPDC001262]|uniref:zf-HC2 domain-containing protein n=1 Tax=unclassified Streptomyces TaxID=2593676 RepID=UPI00368F1ED2
MTGSGGQSPAEHHLGDRLAALVDGELGHESRERVLAHLATCRTCKAEADAQRRLKSVFAEAAPPPLSAGLLARLQGLPGSEGGDSDRGAGGQGKAAGFGALPGPAFTLLPAVAPQPRDSGFRIHEVERGSGTRRRFAFAAAGAVSLAALALVGAQPLETPADPVRARAGDPGVTTTSLNMTPDLAPGRFADNAPYAAPQPAFSAALLRPSGAPVLPPLARASLPVHATR